MTRTEQICNRHMARLLDDLESAECPMIFHRAVKAEMRWLKDDLMDAEYRGEVGSVRVKKDVDRNRAGW